MATWNMKKWIKGMTQMAITSDREYRNFNFEPVEDKEMIVEGIPVVFEQRTEMFEIDGVKYYETVSADAFREALMDDVVLNIDHVGKPAAKTKNGTLELELRDSDIYMKADLSKNATGRELFEDITNGFYDKMSFAFTIKDEEYDKDTRTRTIKSIDRLYDVSAVTIPVYSQTTLNARSYFEAEAEKELMEVRERDLAKAKLELKMKLKGND